MFNYSVVLLNYLYLEKYSVILSDFGTGIKCWKSLGNYFVSFTIRADFEISISLFINERNISNERIYVSEFHSEQWSSIDRHLRKKVSTWRVRTKSSVSYSNFGDILGLLVLSRLEAQHDKKLLFSLTLPTLPHLSWLSRENLENSQRLHCPMEKYRVMRVFWEKRFAAFAKMLSSSSMLNVHFHQSPERWDLPSHLSVCGPTLIETFSIQKLSRKSATCPGLKSGILWGSIPVKPVVYRLNLPCKELAFPGSCLTILVKFQARVTSLHSIVHAVIEFFGTQILRLSSDFISLSHSLTRVLCKRGALESLPWKFEYSQAPRSCPGTYFETSLLVYVFGHQKV